MELLFDQLKDPVLLALFAWTVIELRRIRSHLDRLYTRSEDHGNRLTALEARAERN